MLLIFFLSERREIMKINVVFLNEIFIISIEAAWDSL